MFYQTNQCLKWKHCIGYAGFYVALFSSYVWTFVLVSNFLIRPYRLLSMSTGKQFNNKHCILMPIGVDWLFKIKKNTYKWLTDFSLDIDIWTKSQECDVMSIHGSEETWKFICMFSYLCHCIYHYYCELFLQKERKNLSSSNKEMGISFSGFPFCSSVKRFLVLCLDWIFFMSSISSNV